MLSERQPRQTSAQVASAISSAKYSLCGAMAFHSQFRCSSRDARPPKGDWSDHISSFQTPNFALLAIRRSPALSTRVGERPVTTEIASWCAPIPAILRDASKRNGKLLRTGVRIPISRSRRRRARVIRFRVAVSMLGIRTCKPNGWHFRVRFQKENSSKRNQPVAPASRA